MLAFLGGTGPEGRGLVLRLALAGEAVVIGSRDENRARETAKALSELVPGADISGEVNAVAAQRGDTVFITTPYEGQRPVLEQVAGHLAGKLVVDVDRATYPSPRAGPAPCRWRRGLPPWRPRSCSPIPTWWRHSRT